MQHYGRSRVQQGASNLPIGNGGSEGWTERHDKRVSDQERDVAADSFRGARVKGTAWQGTDREREREREGWE